jgi:tetratricopeptide (TPR) repeat protein
MMLEVATAFSQGGKPDSARSEVRRAVQTLTGELALYPEDPLRRSALAGAYAMLGRRELVIREEMRVLQDAPDNGWVSAHLGLAHVALGEPQRAFELWRRAMQLGCRYQIFGGMCLERIGGEGLRNAPGFADFMKDYEREGERRRVLYAPSGATP